MLANNPTNEELYKYLRESRLFRKLPENFLKQLVPLSEYIEFEEGTTIIPEGKVNQKIFFLVEGTVTVYAQGELILKLSRIGDIFGEMSIISNSPTSAAVVAETKAKVFTVDAKNVHSNQESIENWQRQAILYRIFSVILTDKLALTTAKAKRFEETNRSLHETQGALKGINQEILDSNLSLEKEVLERKAAEAKLLEQATELAGAEALQRHQNNILESILNNMTDAVVVIDENQKLIHSNPKAKDIFGKDNNKKTNQMYTNGIFKDDMITPYTNPELPITRALQGENIPLEELYVKNEYNPEGVWLHVSASPLIDEFGISQGGVSVLRDFTKDKKIKQALLKAKENAEATAQAKSDFLATMSHEIRTPLNGVLGMATLLENTSLDHEQSDYINNIKISGQTLLTVINDILDYSKIEAGKLELEDAPFSLKDCVKESFSIVSSRAQEKNLPLEEQFYEKLPEFIYGDTIRTRQILINLVNNSIKFTDKGKITIIVTHLSVQDDFHEIQFTVQDTGIGVPASRIPHLFESFSQVDSSTTRKYGGTGLGLAICKKLVDLMGGRIWVESTLGEGSRFNFTIKCKEAKNVQQLNSKHHQNKKKAIFDSELGKKYPLHILVAEDNKMNQKLIIKVMSKLGYEIIIAKNGKIALDRVQKEKFDMIFMDLDMPEMGGIEATQKIIKIMGDNAPFIVSMTASAMEAERKKCSEIGMAGYLTKPLVLDQLQETLCIFGDKVKLKEQQADHPPIEAIKKDIIPQQFAEQHPLSILVAEDNKMNQKLIMKVLEKLGYQTVLAENGLVALNVAKEKIFDLILMDLDMPEMGGIESAEKILAHYQDNTPPQIVALTANVLEEQKKKCYDIGMCDYLTKPLMLAKLKTILEDISQRLQN
ncbi:MAG: PAS domain S-box-containing protein [bacterium]|jgi:PAS domain S-box-containing protein